MPYMLWLRGIIFTVLVPCVVGAYLPHLYAGERGGAYQQYCSQVPRWLGLPR